MTPTLAGPRSWTRSPCRPAWTCTVQVNRCLQREIIRRELSKADTLCFLIGSCIISTLIHCNWWVSNVNVWSLSTFFPLYISTWRYISLLYISLFCIFHLLEHVDQSVLGLFRALQGAKAEVVPHVLPQGSVPFRGFMNYLETFYNVDTWCWTLLAKEDGISSWTFRFNKAQGSCVSK